MLVSIFCFQSIFELKGSDSLKTKNAAYLLDKQHF